MNGEFKGSISALADGRNVRAALPLSPFWLQALVAKWVEVHVQQPGACVLMPTVVGQSAFADLYDLTASKIPEASE